MALGIPIQFLGSQSPKRVVIAGNGIGGTTAAVALRDALNKRNEPKLDVTLIGPSPVYTFKPLLLDGLYRTSPSSWATVPMDRILPNAPKAPVRFQQDTVTTLSLSTTGQSIQTASGQTLPCDYLVMALGTSRPVNEPIPGLFRHSLSLETEGDILTLTQRIRSSLEAAASAVPNSPEQEAHRTLVVLGGGPTGVEAALLVKSLAQRIIQAMVPQPRIHPRVVLVHGSGQILSDPVFAPLRSQMTRQLQQAGIEVRLRHWVVSASPDAVTMKDADTGALTSLPTRTAINALGALPNPLGQTLGAAPEKRVPVNAYLESPQHTSVYIIGDLADARDGQGQSLPMLGQVAAQQGHYVAQDLLRKATGQLKPSLPFQYRHRGVTLPTSPQEALLQLPLPGGRSFVLKGRLASWLRHRLYQQKLNAVLPNS